MQLDGMKRKPEQQSNQEQQQSQLTLQEQQNALNDLFCCLNLIGVPADLDPLIINLMLLLQTAQNFENTLNITSPKNLSLSLLEICKSLSTLDQTLRANKKGLRPSDQEIGRLLALFLEKRQASLFTISDFKDKTTVLHHLALSETYRDKNKPCKANQTFVTKILNTLYAIIGYKCAAVDDKVHSEANSAHVIMAVHIVLAAAGDKVHDFVITQGIDRYTALHEAALRGATMFVQAILSAPEVGIQKLCIIKNFYGNTALHEAVLF